MSTRPTRPATTVLTATASRPQRDQRPQTVNDLIAEPMRLRPLALWIISHTTPGTVIGRAFNNANCPVAQYVRHQLLTLNQVAREVIVAPYATSSLPQARFLLKGEMTPRVWLLDEDVATFAREIDRLRTALIESEHRPITRGEAEPILQRLLGAHDEHL